MWTGGQRSTSVGTPVVAMAIIELLVTPGTPMRAVEVSLELGAAPTSNDRVYQTRDGDFHDTP